MSMTFNCRSPEELKQKLSRFAQVFPEGVKQALWEQGHIVMNESKEQVPVDTGYLRSTGYVNEPYQEGNVLGVELGYYANYAKPVHDIPEPPAVSEGGRSAHHMLPTKAFYLSDPMESKEYEFLPRMVSRIEQMLGGE